MRKPIRKTMICRCGCGETFESRLNYRHRTKSGKPTFPRYKRGHHPNCRKTQTGNIPAWNAGLTKTDHPSIARIGFQVGHVPFCDWSHVNERLQNDSKLRAQWLESKKGQIPWNVGLTKDQYPNGIVSGEDHGNWMGGYGGIRDTAAFADFRRSILRRDRWTCVECGDHNHKGRGKRIVLHVDHIIPLCVAPELAMEPTNARTLCFDCHKRTETYGTKVKAYREQFKKAKAAP